MLDLDAVEATFAASTDATVGVEEELAILDPATLDMVGRYEELRDAAAEHPVLGPSIAGELISSEIEIRSGRGEDLADALARQWRAREALLAHAARHGVALGSTGTHPWADYREQRNIDTEHYRRVVDELQYVARRNNTFSVHVHVGVRSIERAVAVCDRLRGVLPDLLAISANSPFLDGRDAGLHSARTQSFTKSFPRCGVPDAYGSWAAYRSYLDLLVRTRSIVEYTQVWWSVRPHIAFGTVEVRVADAQSTAGETDALATLVVACVLQAALEHDEGRPVVELPGRLIEENLWRAIRHGQDGSLLDLPAAAAGHVVDPFPAATAVERLVAWTAEARAAHGLPEPAFPALNGAQRQRRALEAGASMQEVYAASVAETRQTYSSQEAPA
jgi:glutamate---cysteine ligase / carboxylate-amine ligase